MPNQEKVERVAELKARIEGSDALLLTEYRGLSVADITELRRSLAEGGTKFQVIKNTLMRRAVNDAGVAELEALLEGPSAVAFVDGDPVAAAKSVVDAQKKFPTLALKGGYMDGKMLSADEATALAKLESREVDAVEDRRLDEVGDVPGRRRARGAAVQVPVAARGVQGEGARRGTRGRGRASRGRTPSRGEASDETTPRPRPRATVKRRIDGQAQH